VLAAQEKLKGDIARDVQKIQMNVGMDTESLLKRYFLGANISDVKKK
jgi:hypothetical protein